MEDIESFSSKIMSQTNGRVDVRHMLQEKTDVGGELASKSVAIRTFQLRGAINRSQTKSVDRLPRKLCQASEDRANRS
jgi:hypothetical protein